MLPAHHAGRSVMPSSPMQQHSSPCSRPRRGPTPCGCAKKNEGYLQGQIGNPEGDDKPNKKYYDPRAWLRKGEDAFRARLKQAFTDLNNVGTLA